MLKIEIYVLFKTVQYRLAILHAKVMFDETLIGTDYIYKFIISLDTFLDEKGLKDIDFYNRLTSMFQSAHHRR